MLAGVKEIVSIGEFSQRCGLSPKRLRSYAAAGLLRPVAVDPSSGYRYYSLEQLRQAQLIDALRVAGMPIADIGELIEDPTPERLDAWSVRVRSDADQRHQALAAARGLLTGDGAAVHPASDGPGDFSMLRLNAAVRSETGRTRDNNEDAIFAGDRLLIVADGMGGHDGGEVASQLAVSLVKAAYTGRSLDELQAGVRAASRAIWDRAAVSPDLKGMGTTLCAAAITADDDLAVAHVGDSRVYVWREGALVRLTMDHSVTAELIVNGELTEAEAPAHPMRGYITRALGVGPDVEVSSATHSVAAGDRLLMCSDGLCGAVSDEEIATLMESNADVESTADALVKLAQARGSEDDISVVVADVVGYGPSR